jgi:hypothetical protein
MKGKVSESCARRARFGFRVLRSEFPVLCEICATCEPTLPSHASPRRGKQFETRNSKPEAASVRHPTESDL